MRAAGPARAALALLACTVLACASSGEPVAGEAEDARRYRHDRHDYEAFRLRHPGLLEPNYLPFMAYRVRAPESVWDAVRRTLGSAFGLESEVPEEWFVLCHWEESRFPLRVRIEAPEIAPALEDEFDPKPPEAYVDAVERAFAVWQRDLEGRIRFERVAGEAEADLTVRVVGEEAPVPEPERQVLGRAALGGACRAVDGDPESGRLEVRFDVETLRIYVADRHGLLLPDQVEMVALHEIGHALGMRGHSPIPADVMFRVVRDRHGATGLDSEDVNSFLALYSLPSGTVYGPPDRPRPQPSGPPAPPEGPPRLSIAPHVDPRLGFEIQTPAGWQRVRTPVGVVAVDGVSWDYDASFQVVVRRYPSVRAYLERHGRAHFRGRHVLGQRPVEVAGLEGRRFLLSGGPGAMIEELTFLGTRDGRVVVAIAECPTASRHRYRPWFHAALDSLELRSRASEDSRDYSPEAPARERGGAGESP